MEIDIERILKESEYADLNYEAGYKEGYDEGYDEGFEEARLQYEL